MNLYVLGGAGLGGGIEFGKGAGFGQGGKLSWKFLI